MKYETKHNDYWYTPPAILDAVRITLGTNYFDPCPINPEFDGLEVRWGGAVYINPPYSNPLKRAFLRKGEREFDAMGRAYIWLVNYSNSKDLEHLKARASAVCLPHQRIRFIPGHPALGDGASPQYNNIIIMWGGDVGVFCNAFAAIGDCFISPGKKV